MTCEFCNESKPIVVGKRFCSMSCKSKWWIRVKNKERGWVKTEHSFECPWCKSTFTYMLTDLNGYVPKFCSYSCRSLWQAANKIGTAGKTNEERFADYVRKFGEERALLEWESFKQRAWSKENYRKGYETKKEEGTIFFSNPEELAAKVLEDNFDDVERQVSIENWHIDFCINDQVYVEVDGVYWHGLNRPLDEIRKFKSVQDVQILKKYEKDRIQDQYFSSNNMKLVRVTDVEILDNAYIVVERVKNV